MEGALGQKNQILKRTLNGELMAEYADFILAAWRKEGGKGEGMGGGVPLSILPAGIRLPQS